jgi:hypothetical protein
MASGRVSNARKECEMPVIGLHGWRRQPFTAVGRDHISDYER